MQKGEISAKPTLIFIKTNFCHLYHNSCINTFYPDNNIIRIINTKIATKVTAEEEETLVYKLPIPTTVIITPLTKHLSLLSHIDTLEYDICEKYVTHDEF